MASHSPQALERDGDSAQDGQAPGRNPELGLSLTLEEARTLRMVAQRGMIAVGGEGAAPGQPQQAKAALDKLAAAVDDAEFVEVARGELEKAGFETSRHSDAQVTALARRLSDLPRRSA